MADLDILLLVSSLDMGGAERVATTLCNEWAMDGYRVALVSTFPGAAASAFELDPRVEVINLASGLPSRGLGRIGGRINRALRIRKIARDRRPSVIVSFLTNVNVGTIIATIGLKIRTLVAERTYPPLADLSPQLTTLRRITYPLADAVLVQTPEALSWLRVSIPKAHGVILPNPIRVPLARLDPIIPVTKISCDKKVLLSVGRLIPSKDTERVIRCFGAIRDRFPDWHLALAGDGPERTKLETLIADQGLAQDVSLLGRVGNCGDWYARSSAFVTASKYEGFPNALLEAAAYGLPALSLDCLAGPKHIIQHGVNGLLLEAGSSETAFCHALAQLLIRSGELAQQSQATKETYGSSRVAKQWLKEMRLGDDIARPRREGAGEFCRPDFE